MHTFNIACAVAAALIIILLLTFITKISEALKDVSILPIGQRSYSLSKTLIFFWTLIIFFSICYIGIVSDNLPNLDKGVLILMGIVVGTTTAGKVIDKTQSVDPAIARTQDKDSSAGFLTDILSDKDGISVSRFQTVVFNIIYGCSFIAIVITQHVLYNFPSETLTLLGISSGAYALLKIPENTPPTKMPPAGNQPAPRP